MIILGKRPRESTAREEYIVLEPKNIFQLQKFVKTARAVWAKITSLDYFLQVQLLL